MTVGTAIFPECFLDIASAAISNVLSKLFVIKIFFCVFTQNIWVNTQIVNR